MIDTERAKARLAGCYITIPTMFRDSDLELDCGAIRRNIRFLFDGGMDEHNAVILVGGAAGDFQTMSLDEREAAAEAVIDEVNGRIPIVMGAQTINTRELVQLARTASRIGAEYIQVSCPFYFAHTEGDFYEYILSAAGAADIGIVVYNTFWTSTSMSLEFADRLTQIPTVVGLKWGTPDTGFMQFSQMVVASAGRFCIIDNQNQFVISHMMGARGFENHICNFWPQWGVRLIEALEARLYEEVEKMMVEVCMPYHQLWSKIEKEFTSGDGYLDKLCMECVGLESSRNRPPTRDIRPRYRESVRQMLIDFGAPGVR